MRQRLGQHFLKNKETLFFIASHTNAKNGETIIEIGPGHGELTKFLLSEAQKNENPLFCIEKDENFFEIIENLLRGPKNENKLFRGDVRIILPELPNRQKLSNYVLVGNIPYYLTSFLLRIISDLETKPHTTTLLIQKEVAIRASSKPPQQNLLSAIVSSFADAKIIKNVPRGQFSPAPKVDSAVIQLETHHHYTRKEVALYIKIVKILFSHPRKTVYNNLREDVLFLGQNERIKLALQTLNISENTRPQLLESKTMMALAKMLYNEK